jgi:pyrroloquinoline quinone biosynthesis protein D
MNDSSVPTIAAGYRFQWEEAQNCYVLLYPEGMVTLNSTAGEILKYCDGTKNVEEIIAVLQRQYPEAELAEDVHEFLEIAYENGWICTDT